MKLFGFPMSNYYNMSKVAFLEKHIAFEEVTIMPNNEADYLRHSPMGKVPCLETEFGSISESMAIIEYADTLSDRTPLFDDVDAYRAAKIRELCRVVELYIELPARRHYPHVFFGAPRDSAAVDDVKPLMERGISAINQLSKGRPYLCGDKLSAADIVAYHTFGYAAAVAQAIYDWDVIGDVEGLAASRALLATRPSFARTDEALNEAMTAFQAEQQRA